MKLIFIILLLSFVSLFAQDNEIKKLFPGKWKMDFENAEIYEEWEIVNENELIGKSYSIKDGSININENIYLKKFADQWAYVAVPKKQNITLFALVEYTQEKLVFENKEHDFPQRVIYEFKNNKRLLAAIEGEVKGELKRKEFPFIKVVQ